MLPAYYANVTIHVLAALFWLGGMFFLGLVGAPVLRGIEPPELRQRLFHQLGLRFRTLGWIAIAVLITTGILNLQFRGLLRWDRVLSSPTFWRTPFGGALALKLACVTVMLTLSALHDFSIGPRAGLAGPLTGEGRRLRAQSMWMARVNAIVGLLLVGAAVRLARGG